MLMTETYPPIRFWVSVCDNPGVCFKVTFTGRNAEDMALEFMSRRSATHSFAEDEDHNTESLAQYPRYADRMFPSCEHGMSADLCEGPEHYATDAQEMGWGW
jgi:hypothetical protein